MTPRAAKKYIKTATDQVAVKEASWFDPAAAKHVIDFIEGFLSLSKGEWAGKPFRLQMWSSTIAVAMYTADSLRHFQRSRAAAVTRNAGSLQLEVQEASGR